MSDSASVRQLLSIKWSRQSLGVAEKTSGEGEWPSNRLQIAATRSEQSNRLYWLCSKLVFARCTNTLRSSPCLRMSAQNENTSLGMGDFHQLVERNFKGIEVVVPHVRFMRVLLLTPLHAFRVAARADVNRQCDGQSPENHSRGPGITKCRLARYLAWIIGKRNFNHRRRSLCIGGRVDALASKHDPLPGS